MRSYLFIGIVIGIALIISGVSGITVDFSAAPTSGPVPLSVQFTDVSSGGSTGWAWFFGDETYKEPWTLVTAAPGWSDRFGHTSVVMPDGSIVLMGGEEHTADLNDTWRSTNSGATWTRVNASSGWPIRLYHTTVAMPDGSIVLMGGVGDSFLNDTWRSTDKGTMWTLMNASSGWLARYNYASIALPDGSIVLSGGRDDNSRMVNDTWRSTDNGATWARMSASSGWSKRNGHEMVVQPDGSIVLLGGYDGTNTYNDTWKSTNNGATWALVNPNSGWPSRQGHSAVMMPDGSIVLMGGFDGTNIYNDTWRSTNNGATWAQLNTSSGWPSRLHHTSVVMPDGSIALMGGVDPYPYDIFFGDVWRFQPAGSNLQNPVHTYGSAGTYTAALQAFNAVGFSSTQKSGYITASIPPVPIDGGDSSGPAPLAAKSAPVAQASSTTEVNVGGNSAVTQAEVTGTGIAGLIVTGTVQSSPPTGVSSAPGTIYEYISLVPARYTTITGATITFTVPDSWLADHHLSPQNVVLYHYTGGVWTALPTTYGTTTQGQVPFTSTSTGFSLYAISAQPGTPGNQTVSASVSTIGDLAPVSAPAKVTSYATPSPAVQQTTAVPVSPPTASDFPLPAVVAGVLIILVLIGAGFLIRRWWIRRQNPALFRDDG